MIEKRYLSVAWTAFKRWIVAQILDAVIVGLLWFVGLAMIGVPLAPLWAFLGAIFQFIPHFGPVLSLIGPAASAAFKEGWKPMIYVLILYIVIAAVDGIVLQPILMKRTARVPLWASIIVPLVFGLLFNFWGLLLAPPLLAIIYAFREKRKVEASIHPRLDKEP
jgi:predicted PurR-regulated permease PerM